MEPIKIDHSQPTNGTSIGVTAERENEIDKICRKCFKWWVLDPDTDDSRECLEKIIADVKPTTTAEILLVGACFGYFLRQFEVNPSGFLDQLM